MEKGRFFCVFLIVFLLMTLSICAEDSPFHFTLSPSLNIPLGAHKDLYTLGGGGRFSGDVAMPFFKPWYAGADISWHMSPLNNLDEPGIPLTSMHFISGGARTGLDFELLPKFHAGIFGGGGYFYAFFNNNGVTEDGGHPYLYGGGGISYRLVPGFGLGVGVQYRAFLGLYDDLGVIFFTSFHPQKGEGVKPGIKQKEKPAPKPLTEKETPKEKPVYKGSGLELVSQEYGAIFPVMFKWYNTNPIGRATLFNFEKKPVENVRLSFFVKMYMDNPKEAPVVASIVPGEEKVIDIYGLFNQEVLEITEGTTVSANINLTYTLSGKEVKKEYLETIKIQNRNALTWDDDRKAVAFVTAKDPTVLKFAKNTAGAIAAKTYRGIDKNLLLAMALHEVLDLYGIAYIIDPNTPYAELAGSTTSIDYLQFPRQTLEFLAGDCDDLSILYAALLEAAGVETAFVTVPGHIYTAFSLAAVPEEVRKFYLYPDDLIYEAGKAWVPVEVTCRKQGFLKAWITGAKEWRENYGKDQTGFFPVREGWQTYEAVGMPGTAPVNPPGANEILSSFRASVDRFIERETETKAADILASMRKTQDSDKGFNSLGILYAYYGLDDKAEAQFNNALKANEYAPALINLGNLLFIKGSFKEAMTMYERADKAAPNKAAALLGIARTNHELENYGSAKEAYDKLKILSPELADQFSYLALRGEEANRASSKEATKEAVVWEE